jgi:acetyl esterase/lipase
VLRRAADSVAVWRLLIGWALVLLVGCGGSSTGPEDRIVEGVNLTELFAPPTEAEIQDVSAMWEMRDVSAQGVQVAATGAETFSGSAATVRIVSHTVGGVRHYGAIGVADDAADESLPILIYAHGGDGGENVDGVLSLIGTAFGGIPDDYVYVVPSFRSESLRYGGAVYTSDGPPSPWDYDVDDALALLNVAIETTPAADPSRIGVVGFSRGACVAMLMAIRDARIDLVVEFFGPTDFFGEYVQQITEEALLGSPRDLPGLDYLNENIIQPLKDSVLTIAEVRSEMLRRSPVYYVDRLPQLQLHHGTDDDVVAVSQAERLIAAMEAAGRGEPEFQAYLYEGGVHDPTVGPMYPLSIIRAVAFIERLNTLTLAAAGTCP